MVKLLIITPQLPYPPQQGTSLRNYHIIRGLAQGHEITLLSYLEQNQSAAPADSEPLRQQCARLETVPVPPRSQGQRLRQLLTSRLPDVAHRLRSPAMAQKLAALLAQTPFDLVQIEGIELAWLIDIVRQQAPGAKIVFDNHNAETELQRRAFGTDLGSPRRWLAAAYSWVQIGRLSRFERWACRQADWVTVVSESDQGSIEKLLGSGSSSITVIPNSMDVVAAEAAAASAGEPIPFDLLFIGKMDYRPNIDAVLWFADHIWPLIRRQRPQTTWAVVGQKPHPRLERLRSVDGIEVTGRVESVQPYLAGAKVYVMPFRMGSGTRLKLIEAMAAGLPMVSSRVGAEGFPVTDGQELLLAETEAETAAAVLRLLADPAERQRLGQAAQAFARGYDWRQVVTRFEDVYRRIVPL